MHLAILTQYYPPEFGAPQARLSHLAGRAVDRGHRVTVLTAMPNYPLGRLYPGYHGLMCREWQDGMEVIRTTMYPTRSLRVVPRLSSYLSFVGSAAVLGAALLEPPDVLMVESPPLFLTMAGVILARLKKCRMIVNVSDLWPDSAVRLGVIREGGMAERMSLWLERRAYSASWIVTGQSREIVESIEQRFPGVRTYHLSNGVDLGRFGVRTPSERDRMECIVVYAGLHGLAQGLDQVLKAAAQLSPTDGVRFIFIGDGPERQGLMNRAADWGLEHVTFLPPRPPDEIAQFLSDADVVLVPLRQPLPGAVPSKLYEGMASGRPILLVAGGEAASIVREADAGVVVRPGDIDGLVAAVRSLASDSAVRERLGRNARRAAEEQYDRNVIADRFLRFLEAEIP